MREQMANRSEDVAQAVDESIELAAEATKEEPVTKTRRRRAGSVLYNSWGGDDCLFFFRWAELELGFRTHGIEPQAETIGRQLIPMWDNVEELRDKAKRDPRCAAILAEIERTTGGAAARPNQGRQQHVTTQPDKTTDAMLMAARRYRRVSAGMTKLRTEKPDTYTILCIVFLPRRSLQKIEREFKQMTALALQRPILQDAHAAATAKAMRPPGLEEWLEARIDKHDSKRKEEGRDDLVERALAEAEAVGQEAVKAFEDLCEPPPAVKQAMAEAAAKASGEGPKQKRSPRVDRGIPFQPEEA